MKAASLQEIRQQLQQATPAELTEYCLRLARHKVENKELLTFLLYEKDDEAGFIRGVKEQADELFSQMNTSQVYFAKKGLRKILRILQKNIRFAASRQVEIELLLHFCDKLLQSELPVTTHRILANILDAQLRKIDKAIGMLHEDLQYDYRKSLNRILAAADMS
jgi:hypothetical protein